MAEVPSKAELAFQTGPAHERIAALAGELDNVVTTPDPVFGLHIPSSVRGVPAQVLTPRNTWSDGADYDAQASKLADMFRANFKQFEGSVPDAVKAAGPL